MEKWFCIVLVLGISNIFAQDTNVTIVIQLDQGAVRGYKSTVGNFYGFYGIPYATAPTGVDKFKAPLSPPSWTEILDAVDRGVVCPQYPPYLPSNKIIQEDCLIANVYVPDVEEDNLPVVVYVHGGSYFTSYGKSLEPLSLVNEGKFIAVNFNYRLGIHGFLCLGTEVAPGNAGMKDQVALLRWVKTNIEKFGGNPNDVTLSGYSAGGSAVELLTLSPTTEGLFHKVIPESGSEMAAWSIQVEPLENAKHFANNKNFTSDDVKDLEEFYTAASFETLYVDDFMKAPDGNLYFVPCVERDDEENPFLTEAPIDILKRGDYIKYPKLVGFTDMEGEISLDNFDEFRIKMNEDFTQFLPIDLQFESDEQKQYVAQLVKEFYFGNQTITADSLEAYLDLFTDISFVYPAIASIRMHLENGDDNLFLYEYKFPDDLTSLLINNYNITGASHIAQTMSLLDDDGTWAGESTYSEEFQEIRNITRDLWTNFILTGQPVPEANGLYPEGWPALTTNGSPLMVLNVPPELQHESVLLRDRMQLWIDIYDVYYRTPQPPPPSSSSLEIGNRGLLLGFLLILCYRFSLSLEL